MRNAPIIIAVLAGLGVGIILVVVFALANPFNLPTTQVIKSVNISKSSIITQSEAEVAARDHLDKLLQSNGEQAGVHRGGKLGSAELIFVDKDGANYVVDRYSGTMIEKLPYPIDGSKPNQYIWKITLNLGNSSKPEYVYAVNGSDGKVWMIGVIDW